MDFSESDGSVALRDELRELIGRFIQPDFLGAFTDDPLDLEATQRFCRELGNRGLISRSWPGRFGGDERGPWEQMALREEMWAHHEPRGAQYMNVNWVAPAIMRFGTPAQQEQHLPSIAAGEELWCQGFSEPEAGSDLASLRTVAKPSGADWQIFGQKVWTSYATFAEWMCLLARTDPVAEKHRGITVFLLPMDRPGIEVRPIQSMVGPHHLNEVFFDGVPVGIDDVLGDVNDGWRVVRETLALERLGIARYARCERLLLEAPVIFPELFQTAPQQLIARWSTALTHARQTRLLAYRVIDKQDKGPIAPADAAAYRISVTRLDQETAEVLFDLLNGLSLGPSEDAHRKFVRAVEDHWRYAQASTIASGTIEMQRLLLSRSLLGA